MKHITDKIVNVADTICMSGAMISLIAIMLATNIDVVLRKFADKALPGLYSITEDYLMVALVFLSISYVYSKGGHVKVTLFEKYIPRRVKPIINVCLAILAMGYFLLIAVGNWQAAHEAWIYNETTTSGLGYSMAPAIFLVCLGCGVTGLRILNSLINPNDSDKEMTK